MIEAAATTAWYVYGVVRSDVPPPPTTQLVEHGGLAAVAAQVSLTEFGEDALHERLNDRAWLEENVRTHETVLEAFVGRSPVVPLRFGAIYRDLEDVRRLLGEREDFFAATLERLDGRVELGVKAWYHPERLQQPAAGGGRAYLERRRGELGAERAAAAAAATAHERLSALADEAVANRPQPRELTGRTERMLLNGAYLVCQDDAAFADELERLGEEHAPLGVAYEPTGPWPPYNFVREEDA